MDHVAHKVELVDPVVDAVFQIVLEAVVVEVLCLQHLFFQVIEVFVLEVEQLEMLVTLGLSVVELDVLILLVILFEFVSHLVLLF